MQKGPNSYKTSIHDLSIKIKDDLITAIVKSLNRFCMNPDDEQMLAFIRGLLHQKIGNYSRAIAYYDRVEEIQELPYSCHADILEYAIECNEGLRESIKFEENPIVDNTPLTAKNSLGRLVEEDPDDDYAVYQIIALLHEENRNYVRAENVRAEYWLSLSQRQMELKNPVVANLWQAYKRNFTPKQHTVDTRVAPNDSQYAITLIT